MSHSLATLDRETRGLKLFPLFTLLGWLLIGLSLIILVAVLAPTGAAYWGGQAKAARDAAEAGSLLQSQLATLASTPKYLAPLVFTGVASFMVGIAMEFAAIPAILARRTEVLKQAIPLMGSQ